ncbi:Lipoamide acyltransferase [Neofusicoccum parvum]|uniref:Dihydrolipoamide acetyltransferase component of pyruvate dehydrogenase complex n=2 Tax=Neofusicoccum parvum TaxID=310453 RepID=R1GUV4_BOTPV|nr:putative 2-oxoacid dehydrogenase acyltransferase protein [Neofusicoccum parvum UCRNP2]GME24870.1 Lipoamide acyltransferase [Neofusicoccum parvum]GME51345.1 Lipoamide acyltransferase [Neofusicoccum parvum]
MRRFAARDARCLAAAAIESSYPLRRFKTARIPRQHPSRPFHASAAAQAVKPYLLADIGEGITECQVIQWFVQPGARVEQFDKICEVQSDKATVEITSRFDGVIKKLHYEADEVAKVGKPLVDIDIQSEISEEDQAIIESPEEKAPQSSGQVQEKQPGQPAETSRPDASAAEPSIQPSTSQQKPPPGKHANLATPAVRHLLKQHNLNISDIEGTGRDGRVLKDDIQRHVSASKQQPTTSSPESTPTFPPPASAPLTGDRAMPLSPIQKQMFKTMTRSLAIPHFLYTDTVDFTSLNTTRRNLATADPSSPKLSALPFIIKAVSLALTKYPTLNAYLDTTNEAAPQLIHKAQHDIGIAVDSPSGLVVPVVRHVQAHSIGTLAAEIARLARLARDGKLTSNELGGPTFTVSNIGSIGGTAVAPVIVPPQVGILGVGRARAVPAFGPAGELVRREEAVFSWSADHRVVDGATAARCAEEVRALLEGVEGMLVRLR